MKKILLLGGSPQQLIAIETAKKLGLYTVLCDYLPDNPGQYVADRFYQVSTTDKDAILEVARQEQVSGVLAYASDPAAPTAAYVAEKMGLPGNPCESVEILCNKDRFRRFLKENGFPTPEAQGYEDVDTAARDIAGGKFRFPILIKPVDSSGSKGITKVASAQQVPDALQFALSFSRSQRVIVEEFVEKKYPYLIGGDIFVMDGKVILWGLMNCHRDGRANPLVPVGKSYPPQMEPEDLQRAEDTLQRLVTALNIRSGPMNVELVVDCSGRVFLLDIGPRSGGNMIPDLLSCIFHVDIAEMSVKLAMGQNFIPEIAPGEPCWATYNLHALENGIYDRIDFSEEIQPFLVKKYLYKHTGDSVEFFDNASKALGIVFLRFENTAQMHEYLNHTERWIRLRLKANS